jgi:hemoglobin-like flavoprotein
LFELDPTLRPLFKGDMEEQGRKLMEMIELAVRGLDRQEALLPALAALGRRHAGYGVNESDYETVGAALLWTLEQGLGPSFTPDIREAWAALYRFVADTMRDGAVAA